MLTIKCSTLCLEPQSKFAKDFSRAKWMEEHQIELNDGRRVCLVELPAFACKTLLDQLYLKSITKNEQRLPQIEFEEDFHVHGCFASFNCIW